VPLVVVNGQIMGTRAVAAAVAASVLVLRASGVYIAILRYGVTSQILSTFSRKPIFGYKAMVYAMLSIGFFGFMVWATTCS